MSYTTDEIRALIDHYETHRYSDRLWIRVRYADLSAALDALPGSLRDVVFLHGLARWNVRDTASALEVSKSTVSRHYIEATEWMADYLSGAEVQ